MNDSAAAKLKMLQASIRCLVFGLLGLVPVLGLPFALAALWISGRVRQQEKQRWNAARPYRLMGVACAALGAVLWTGILIIAVFRLIMIAQGLG
jgi:hypothetical protein